MEEFNGFSSSTITLTFLHILDYAKKNVLVIDSEATCMSLDNYMLV
jgi:hypothetical protein